MRLLNYCRNKTAGWDGVLYEDDQNATYVSNGVFDWPLTPKRKADLEIVQNIDLVKLISFLESRPAAASLLSLLREQNGPQSEAATYPELESYDDEHYLTLFRPECDPDEGPTYEVVFDIADDRYYCYVQGAVSVFEALGLFFMEHPHITYEMVVDHFEV